MTYKKMKEMLGTHGYDLVYQRIIIGSKYTLTKTDTGEEETFFSKRNLEDYIYKNIIDEIGWS